MGRLTFAMIVTGAVVGVASAKVPAELKAYSRSVRYVHHRDRTSVPGSTIIHWYRDGRPDWIMPPVETNVDHSVVGKHIDNPTEEAAKWTRKVRKDSEKAEKKDQKNFENWLKDTKKALSKSSEDMRPFYEDILFFATNREVKVDTAK